MAKRRKFTREFKAAVVIEVHSGVTSSSKRPHVGVRVISTKITYGHLSKQNLS